MNPLMNNSVKGILNSMNPQQMALGMLQARNPMAFQMITQMMQTTTPNKAMQNLGITNQQMQDFKNKYSR